MRKVEDAIRLWLEAHSDYEVEGEPRAGTFGHVWVMKAMRETIAPQLVARKTINPEKLAASNGNELLPTFEREMHIWLHMPHHPNVLPALGIDIAELPKWVDSQIRRLPLVRMPYCECSLTTWVETPLTSISLLDRLVALSQLANGLRWLYDHGIQGHGDLKPDNVLVSKFRSESYLSGNADPIGWPIIRVADLGWANAWIDLGFSDKAWRPYLAPERFDGMFCPIASDIFALGVIAAELLQAKHPAGDIAARIGKWKESKYRKWAVGSERHLTDINPPAIQQLVSKCLHSQAEKRPTITEFIDVVTEITQTDYDVNASELLSTLNRETSHDSTFHHEIWAAREIAVVGEYPMQRSLRDLELQLQRLGIPQSLRGICEWFYLADLAVRIHWCLHTKDNIARVGEISRTAQQLIEQRLFPLLQSGWDQEWEKNLKEIVGSHRSFEAFAELLGKGISILEFTIDPFNTSTWIRNADRFCRAAYHFNVASDAYLNKDNETWKVCLDELDICTRLLPNEATFHFFRGIWIENAILLGFAPETEHQRLQAEAEEALLTASQMEPNWKGPANRLHFLNWS